MQTSFIPSLRPPIDPFPVLLALCGVSREGRLLLLKGGKWNEQTFEKFPFRFLDRFYDFDGCVFGKFCIQ